MENIISSAEKIEIPEIVAGMSAGETEKLSEILRTMEMFQQERQARELTDEQIKDKSTELLEQQKAQPEKFGLLDLLKVGNNSKIKRRQEKSKKFTLKINNLKGEIRRISDGAENIKKRISKCELKIQKNSISDEFMKSVFPENKLTNPKAVKIQKRLETLQEMLSCKLLKIELKKEKINRLQQKLEKNQDRINSLNDKNRAIAEIKSFGTPNAVLSYFLSEKSGISVPELTSAVNHPEKYFKPEEINSGQPVRVSEILKNQITANQNNYHTKKTPGGLKRHIMQH